MKKIILVLFFVFASRTAFAQLEVVPGSLKHVKGFVYTLLDRDKQYDENGKPTSLIKLKTQNIDDEQRRRLKFAGDMQTAFMYDFKEGEIWIYLTSNPTYIKITHPDYSVCEYYFPIDLKPHQCYELILANNFDDRSIYYVSVTLTTDSESDIYVDNEYKGKGGWNGKLSSGKHLVEVKKDLHYSVKQVINLSNEDKDIIIESPKPINGILNIRTVPERAAIFIDSINYGNTNKTIYLIIGNHELRLEKEGYAPLIKQITIEENRMISLEEKLDKQNRSQNKFGWFIRLGGDMLTQIVLDNKNELNTHSDFGYNFSSGFMSPIKNKGAAYWGMAIGLSSELGIESFNYEGDFQYDSKVNFGLELSPFTGWKIGNGKVKFDPHLGVFLGYGFGTGFTAGCDAGLGLWLGRFNIDAGYHQSFVPCDYKYYNGHEWNSSGNYQPANLNNPDKISYLPYSIRIRVGFIFGRNR